MKFAYTLLVCSLAAIVIGGNAQAHAESDEDEAEVAELLANLEEEMEAREQNLDASASLMAVRKRPRRPKKPRRPKLPKKPQRPKLPKKPQRHKLPKKPQRPKLPKKPCCQRDEMNVGLGSSDGDVRGKLLGVTVIQAPTAQTGSFANKPCSKTALLKVNFEKITDEYSGDFCLENPYCGRRMLKVDMDLSADKRGSFLFNVGDSVSNNGWAGDSNHQTNDAEMQGAVQDIYVFSSDKCKTNPKLKELAHFDGVIGSAVDHVTLYISNEHIRITNNAGFDEKICHRCLYALNGQPDTGPLNPGPNEDIYISFNRVVNGYKNRNGHGMCSATLTWTCPWN